MQKLLKDYNKKNESKTLDTEKKCNKDIPQSIISSKKKLNNITILNNLIIFNDFLSI